MLAVLGCGAPAESVMQTGVASIHSQKAQSVALGNCSSASVVAAAAAAAAAVVVLWKEVIPELLALGAHLHLKGGAGCDVVVGLTHAWCQEE